MRFISENKISEELVNSFSAKMNLGLAKRLEKDNSVRPFYGLKNLLCLRELALKRHNLKSDYIYLFYKEPFNAN